MRWLIIPSNNVFPSIPIDLYFNPPPMNAATSSSICRLEFSHIDHSGGAQSSFVPLPPGMASSDVSRGCWGNGRAPRPRPRGRTKRKKQTNKTNSLQRLSRIPMTSLSEPREQSATLGLLCLCQSGATLLQAIGRCNVRRLTLQRFSPALERAFSGRHPTKQRSSRPWSTVAQQLGIPKKKLERQRCPSLDLAQSLLVFVDDSLQTIS